MQGVVLCAGGLRVAQSGISAPGTGADLFVGPVAAVSIPDTSGVEARVDDYVVWRRHWSEPERLVVQFVDLASAQVDDVSGTVTFDRPLDPEMEQHLLFDHLLPLVLARRGALVLHGGVISLDGVGVVLVGATGAGKSTLTAYAWQQGWTVGGDDGAVVHVAHPPTVEPTYPTLRLTAGATELLGIDPVPGSTVVGKVRVTGSGGAEFRRSPVRLGVVAIIEPVHDDDATARFEPLRGVEAHAHLFGSTFHADLSGDRRLPTVLADLAAIVESTTVGRLFVPRGLPGLAAAEQLLRSRVAAVPS